MDDGCNKYEVIRLWIETHHPTKRFVQRSNGPTGYILIEDPQREDVTIEIDFYQELDSFYVYPRHHPPYMSGPLRGIQTLWTINIADPSYFIKIDEMIRMASIIDVDQPPDWNGRPLWTTH